MQDIQPDIIQRCKRGDERAFAEVYKASYGFLLGTVKRYVYDHEEAVFQMNTGFANAMCKIDKYEPTSPFHVWIQRVVINSTIDFLRKRNRYHEHLDNYREQVMDRSSFSIEFNGGQDQMEYEDLLKLLDCLPEVTRDVFNLFVIDGYKHEEIGRMLSISIGTSKWHLSSARKKLVSMIRHRGELKGIYGAQFRTQKKVL